MPTNPGTRRPAGRDRAALAAAAVLAVVLTVVLAVVLLGGRDQAGREPAGRPPAAPPGSSAGPAVTVNPLTGEGRAPAGPVVAVKIDDTRPARPQWGLDQADVVYVEQVEGGLTRLVAVFGSRLPRQVGPVRSVRASDPELLAGYGPAALAFAGGAAYPLGRLHASALVDASPAAVPRPYTRIASRRAPYNLAVDLAALAGTLHGRVAGARDVGFRWGVADPRLAAAPRVAGVTVVVGGTPLHFRWQDGRWVRTVGGSPMLTASGAAVSTPNVLVQQCRVSVDRRDVDQAGSPSMYTHTIGHGAAVLFRDGRRLEGTWSRPTAGAPVRFRSAAGRDLLLRPGGVWVLLTTAGQPATVTAG